MHRSLAAAVTTAALALAVAPATTAQAADGGQNDDAAKTQEVLGAVAKGVTKNGLPVGLPTDGLGTSLR